MKKLRFFTSFVAETVPTHGTDALQKRLPQGGWERKNFFPEELPFLSYLVGAPRPHTPGFPGLRAPVPRGSLLDAQK